MTIDETFNIHKKINCMLPFFKSKLLCKKGIHNYRLHLETSYEPEVEEEFDPKCEYVKHRVVRYNVKKREYWKCYCCGNEEILDEK